MTQSRTAARLFTLVGAAVAVVALFASSASAKEPAPGFTQFAGCPSQEEHVVFACLRTEITGGNFQMGSKDVPITNPIVLSGGFDAAGNVFASPKGGMSKSPQKVPGGVIGLTGLTWLLEFFGSEALTLYAETELAGLPKLDNGGEKVTLPIRVHLINGVLGSKCYVGSFTQPIVLNLTTGTTNPPGPNEPITGTQPEVSFDELGIVHADNGQYVDNAFAAPGANGCTLTLFGFIPISINGLVNSQSGLPAPAGTNETRQDFDLELASQEQVYP